MKNLDFGSKRKQDRIENSARRNIQVKVMLNDEEALILDRAREASKLSRAEAMRALFLNRKIERAPIVPEVNREFARNLGRALGNLAAVASVMREGKYVGFDDIRYVVHELQKTLRGEK